MKKVKSRPAALWTLLGGQVILAVRPDGWKGPLTFQISEDARARCRFVFMQEPKFTSSYVFKVWLGQRPQGDPDLRGVEYVRYTGVFDDFLEVCPRSRIYEVEPDPEPVGVPNVRGFLPVGKNWNDSKLGTYLEVATLADLTVLRMMD